ncbi:transposase [Nocardia nova]|uniref:RNA-guided endonuclease InsQ/TnpB family protein n=1 Tax=Nocardia nova TaxID=37330 RepID=UPI0025B1FB48|nr:RNA-guided endonuclease TnpB family protein [Nocardia nova]MDN2496723.1 transposase [Nocardia nova]
MYLRYSFRIYPTPGQRRALARTFGCARVVFNDALQARRAAHLNGQGYLSDAVLSKQLTQAKRTSEREWLNAVPAAVLQQALADANAAYRNFFNGLTGKRAGSKVGPPKFRSRKNSRQTIRYTRNTRFRVTVGGKLRLPRIGEIVVRWSRKLPSDPSSVTIIKDGIGRYFASFVVQLDPEPLPELDTEVGVDLGLRTFAVLSDGTQITPPRFLRRAERRLRRAQRELSRKQPGSSNRARARLRVAKCHARVRDSRADWLQKRSSEVIRDNQAVYVEDLCVNGLARTRLAKSIYDAGWASFVRLLQQKAERRGRHFSKVNRYFPSSRMCSECGRVDDAKPLSVRSWRCPQCGTVHDRDLNAARNILAAGRAERLNACGAQVSPGCLTALRGEAGTHREELRALAGVSALV